MEYIDKWMRFIQQHIQWLQFRINYFNFKEDEYFAQIKYQNSRQKVFILASRLYFNMRKERSAKMSEIWTFAVWMWVMTVVQCKDCMMTETMTFHECQMLCLDKYGEEKATSREFFNRKTGMCESKVECKETPHRIYENRCIKEYEEFKVGNQQAHPIETLSVIRPIVVHGSDQTLVEKRMCYPGYISSRRTVEIIKQKYEEYYCDIPIGYEPAIYPRTTGEYFFHKLSSSVQVQKVAEVIPQPELTPYDFFLMLIFAYELGFLGATLHWVVIRAKNQRSE